MCIKWSSICCGGHGRENLWLRDTTGLLKLSKEQGLTFMGKLLLSFMTACYLEFRMSGFNWMEQKHTWVHDLIGSAYRWILRSLENPCLINKARA